MNNNTWHTYNQSNTVYIFVHGFFSNSQACWTSKDGTRWPDLITDDNRLGSPSVFTAGYYTAVDSGEYKIADCARELYEALRLPDLNGVPPPLEKSKLVFVCHSLGGIVTRYMIERNREVFKEKEIALLLIASPSFGAALADSFRGIIKVYRNKLAEQLTAANESLEDLDDRFKDLIAQKKIYKLVGAEAYEHHFPLHWKLIPGLKPIVSKSSASRYFGPSKLLHNTDHSSCVKPTSHLHVSHKFLVSTILDLFPPDHQILATSEMGKTQDSNYLDTLSKSRSDVLFEVYVPMYEAYYVSTKMDEAIVSAISLFSIWVYGESGVGKTALIHRATTNKNISVIHTYIGATADTSKGCISLLREIYYTISMKLGRDYRTSESLNQIVADVAGMIADAAREKPMYLIIDEVPLIGTNSDEVAKFISALHAVMISVKQLVDPCRLRIVITSIFDPKVHLPKGSERIFEQIKFLQFTPWQHTDSLRLVDLISSYFPEVISSHNDKKELARLSRGLPRFIKTFFRNATVYSEVEKMSFAARIKETTLLLGMDDSNTDLGE